MPRLVNETPKYRKHRASGQAIVTIAGKDHYLGPHGSKASRIEYDRLVGEWLAAGRPTAPPAQPNDITVAEVINAFRKWAQRYYIKDGQSTGTWENYKPVLRLLRRLYGNTPAVEFGPLALKSIQRRFVEQGQSRRYANDNISRLKKMFRWAASEQLIPVSVVQALDTVSGLEKGRTDARETDPVRPVDDAAVEATIPYLCDTVADMVRLQRLTGMRPGEVCILRPCDVDTSGEMWVYRPESHKTEHHGRERVIFIGPQGQSVLRRYLLCPFDAYCFSPAESERKRNARRREERQTPMTPSQAKRRRKRRRSRAPGDCYTNDSYRRVIHRACDKAFLPPEHLRQRKGESRKAWRERLSEQERAELAAWQYDHRWAPNQLRHAAATEIRRRFGLEAAQVALGHSKADVTQVYAERDLEKARSVMREVG